MRDSEDPDVRDARIADRLESMGAIKPACETCTGHGGWTDAAGGWTACPTCNGQRTAGWQTANNA